LPENFIEVRRTIIEHFLKELETQTLLTLEKNFYEKMFEEIRALKEAALKSSNKDLRKKVLQESSDLEEILRRLFLCRIVKAIKRLSEEGEVEYGKLLDIEKDALYCIIGKYEKIQRRVENELTKRKTPKQRYRLVCFVKNYPKILASDGRSYGPFRENDVVLLPVADALYLKRKGVVKFIGF